MPLVFPNIVRYSIVADLQGEMCVNIFDIDVDGEALEAPGREATIAFVGGDLLNQWSDHILPILVPEYVAQEIRWVDLDSLAGSTGTVTSTDGSDWPMAGSYAGNAPNSNAVYAKVIKRLEGSARNQRNGMTRLSGTGESSTGADGNRLTPAYVTAVNDGFEDLKDGINGDTGPGGLRTDLGVLHTVNNVATGFSQIATFSCATVVGTLKRRMPGYGD